MDIYCIERIYIVETIGLSTKIAEYRSQHSEFIASDEVIVGKMIAEGLLTDISQSELDSINYILPEDFFDGDIFEDDNSTLNSNKQSTNLPKFQPNYYQPTIKIQNNTFTAFNPIQRLTEPEQSKTQKPQSSNSQFNIISAQYVNPSNSAPKASETKTHWMAPTQTAPGIHVITPEKTKNSRENTTSKITPKRSFNLSFA